MDIDSKKLGALERKLLNSRRLLTTVKQALLDGDINREIMMALLQRNPNIIDPDSARHLLSSHVMSRDDFNDAGIDYNFLDLLDGDDPVDPADASDFVPLDGIAPGATEVYFWGIPASGKSCALGSIMSVARNGNDVMKQHQCQGGDYMSRLSQVFHHDGYYSYLPAGTAIKNTYEMRFSLIRDKKEHPLSFIDMSGELFKCLYKKYTNIVLNDDEQQAFDVLNHLLVDRASENRKLHFFVIEYGAENKKIDGLQQDTYLQRAAEYLDQLHVFDEYTDAIYIILTKADKAGHFDTIDDEINHFKNYMSKNYYGFYKELREMCSRHSINGGELRFVSFSVGDIVLRRMCRFNASYASEILDYIMERSFFVERNAFGKIKRILRN